MSFIFRFVGAVMPPDNIDDLFDQGYDQTEEFLQSEKFKKFLTDLSVPTATETDVPDLNGAILPEVYHA